MGIPDKFQSFCSNIQITQDVANSVSYRYKRITRQLNSDFYDLDSDTSHSLYVGSYGRNTAMNASDVDILFQLKYSDYLKYNGYVINGQSSLLQDIRTSLLKTFGTSHISGDGQVVEIDFNDNINFDIVPAFVNIDGSFTYPDSNNGGSWKTTNPKREIESIRDANIEWNSNLKRLCRMIRAWKDHWNVPIGGLLIDTLAYNFMENWKHRVNSFVYYDWLTRDFFEYLKNQNPDQNYWRAPGSGQSVARNGNFEYKALQCYNISLEALNYESNKQDYSANLKWREIYGYNFPS
ncbi:MAG: hypothetical protein ACD_19C00017G0026 [uncultured bacterium]|nr:MAG: hypothetical protein ACD_19C00017G0026 [uncultured bacterium]